MSHVKGKGSTPKIFGSLFYQNQETAERNKGKRRCLMCIYGCKNIGEIGCDYLILEHHRRPCPMQSAEYRCTAFVSNKGKKIKRDTTPRYKTMGAVK